MQGESFSLEDFRELFKEGLATQRSQYRVERFGGLEREQLLWTALAPSWTVQLAQKSDFPAGDVAVYLEDLHQRSLVRKSLVRGDEDDGPALPVYTMDDVTRGDILETLADERDEIAALDPLLTVIGNSVLKAIDQRVSSPPFFAPPAIARWALLAVGVSQPGGIAKAFDAQVEQAFQKRSSITIRDWINSGQSFSALLIKRGDDSMKQALLRASQRLVLLQRDENDQRHLKYFYQRDEQLHAFEELMNADDSSWALHFLGAGGVGKTMLVRKITVDWARDHDAIAARIDFDYLKADYPTLDPGMLLWAFAQDLRAHANSRAIGLFNQADRRLADLSKRIRAELSDGLRKRATDYPEFSEALSAYTDALRLMPQRVLLIVDTCEELAKIGIGRTPVENIDETFRILRALHDGAHTLRDESASPAGGVPNLRVIFSGRRPLSSEGINWRCPDASQLKPRSFLRLHEVRGFKQTDAVKFLEDKMHVVKDLIPAIVTRSSPDTGSVADIDWDDPADGPTQEPRCNPYDLKLYAEWAREDPPPTAKEILETPPATQYVELRVIRRLHFEPLKDVLPAVGMLGHFDRDALREILKSNKDPETIDTIFDVLQQEEWINQHLVQDSDGAANLILDVEPGLRARLFVYFNKSPLLAEFQPRAADYFEKLTLESDLSKLDWSSFDTALAVLESDPDKARAIRWWKQVEERMVLLQTPEWIRNVTQGIQNEGGAAAWRDPNAPPDAPPESRLRSSVLATHASALLRSAKLADIKLVWRELRAIWLEVLYKAEIGTIPQIDIRALAGFVAATFQSADGEPNTEHLERLWRFIETQAGIPEGPFFDRTLAQALEPMIDDLQLGASLVAAAEAAVEYAEQRVDTDPIAAQRLLGLRRTTFTKWQPCVITLLPGILPKSNENRLRSLNSFAFCLAARAETILGNFEEAKRLFADSLALVEYGRDDAAPQSSWLDWRPPEDTPSRVFLEFMRAAYPTFMSPQDVFDLVYSRAPNQSRIDRKRIEEGLPVLPHDHYPPVRLRSIDNERMHSALLRIKSARGPLTKEDVEEFGTILSPAGMQLYVGSQPGTPINSGPDPEVMLCRAHQLTPPLFVTVGEILATNGRADMVLTDLAAVAGSSVKVDYETLLAIDRACSKIIMQMRLRDVGEKGGQTLATSSDISDKQLAWALDAQDGPKNRKPIPQLPPELSELRIKPVEQTPIFPDSVRSVIQIQHWAGTITVQEREKLRWLHAIWQTRFVFDRTTAESLLVWAERNFKWYVDSQFARYSGHELAAIQMDIAEAHVLATKYHRELNLSAVSKSWRDPSDFFVRVDLKPVEALSLWLRAMAIGDALSDRTTWERGIHPAAKTLGLHRAAEIARYEADLLALRLPERANLLYREAQAFSNRCNDHVGAFLAGTSEAMTVSRSEVKNLTRRLTSYYVESQLSDQKDLNLPSADALKQFVEKKEEEVVKDWAARSWRPRLVRYTLLLVAEKFEEKRAEVGKQIIQRNLPEAFSETTDATDLLPADLTNWLTGALEPPSIFRRIFKSVQQAFPILLGVGVFVFIIYLAFRVFRWLFSFLVPDFSARSGGSQLGTFVIVVLTISLMIRLLVKVKRRSASLATEPTTVSDEAANVKVQSEVVQAPSAEYPTWRIWLDSGIIWALVAVIVWFYFGDVFTRFSWSRLALVVSTAIVGSLLIVFRGRLSRLRGWLDRKGLEAASFYFTGLARLELTVRATDASASTSAHSLTEIPEVEISVLRTLPSLKFAAPLFFGLQPHLIFSGIRGKSGGQPYESVGEDLASSAFPSVFHDLRQRLRKYPLTVQIDLPEGSVNGLCWEALIPKESETNEFEDNYLPFNCYRRLSVITKRAPTRVGTSVLAFAGSDVARHAASEGWGALASTAVSKFELAEGERVFSYASPEVSVVHLIGTIENSYLGLGFRSREERFTPTQSSKTTEDGGGLIRVEDLTRSFPNLSVCIIQEEPRQLSSQRLEGDRRDAFFARLFASEMFAAGLPLVLVVPPLRSTEAVMIVEGFAKLLARASRLRRPVLLRTVADMRLLIGRYARTLGVEPAAVQELPQDLCLYLNPDWDGRLS